MAISVPLLDVCMEGARGVLLNITGGSRPGAERDQRGRRRSSPRPPIPRRTSSSARSSIRGWRTRSRSRSSRRASTCPQRRRPAHAAARSAAGRATDVRQRSDRAAPQEPRADRSGRDRPPVEDRDRDRPPDRDTGPIRVGSIGEHAAGAGLRLRRRPGHPALPARSASLSGRRLRRRRWDCVRRLHPTGLDPRPHATQRPGGRCTSFTGHAQVRGGSAARGRMRTELGSTSHAFGTGNAPGE